MPFCGSQTCDPIHFLDDRRAWEARMSSPSYTLDMFMEHFRAICDAVILYCVRERTQKTQAASLLLDHGNARFAAMERSSGCALTSSRFGLTIQLSLHSSIALLTPVCSITLVCCLSFSP